jgi:two-component system phosphate regulon response regulator OmpR
MATTSTASVPRDEPLPDDAPHLLIVDDDHKIRERLTSYLVRQGFRVTSASDTEAARGAMRGLRFDLVLLDVMMPGQSGLEFARELRASSDIPICLLTARSDPEERVAGLEIGVEDYVAKPFEPRELVLRLRNIMRRGQAPSKEHTDEVRMGCYTFHIGRGELRRGDESIKLTERERDLLRHFANRRGMPVPRHELTADESTGSERAIDVQINRLRRKIETDPSNPVYLQTVRGKGYILYTD